ncbi:hypothetical protein B5S30_g3024 [[Candida] boidinii]|nr:hypothetical protein B5S30_g3024 [[Candida] boidinii]
MSEKLKRTRKKHTNSHLGCETCKKRRIKCDEFLPSCKNCLRLNIICPYLSLPFDEINEIRETHIKHNLVKFQHPIHTYDPTLAIQQQQQQQQYNTQYSNPYLPVQDLDYIQVDYNNPYFILRQHQQNYQLHDQQLEQNHIPPQHLQHIQTVPAQQVHIPQLPVQQTLIQPPLQPPLQPLIPTHIPAHSNQYIPFPNDSNPFLNLSRSTNDQYINHTNQQQQQQINNYPVSYDHTVSHTQQIPMKQQPPPPEQSAQPVQPVHSVQPVQSVQKVQPVQPPQPEQPVQPVKETHPKQRLQVPLHQTPAQATPPLTTTQSSQKITPHQPPSAHTDSKDLETEVLSIIKNFSKISISNSNKQPSNVIPPRKIGTPINSHSRKVNKIIYTEKAELQFLKSQFEMLLVLREYLVFRNDLPKTKFFSIENAGYLSRIFFTKSSSVLQFSQIGFKSFCVFAFSYLASILTRQGLLKNKFSYSLIKDLQNWSYILSNDTIDLSTKIISNYKDLNYIQIQMVTVATFTLLHSASYRETDYKRYTNFVTGIYAISLNGVNQSEKLKIVNSENNAISALATSLINGFKTLYFPPYNTKFLDEFYLKIVSFIRDFNPKEIYTELLFNFCNQFFPNLKKINKLRSNKCLTYPPTFMFKLLSNYYTILPQDISSITKLIPNSLNDEIKLVTFLFFIALSESLTSIVPQITFFAFMEFLGNINCLIQDYSYIDKLTNVIKNHIHNKSLKNYSFYLLRLISFFRKRREILNKYIVFKDPFGNLSIDHFNSKDSLSSNTIEQFITNEKRINSINEIQLKSFENSFIKTSNYPYKIKDLTLENSSIKISSLLTKSDTSEPILNVNMGEAFWGPTLKNYDEFQLNEIGEDQINEIKKYNDNDCDYDDDIDDKLNNNDVYNIDNLDTSYDDDGIETFSNFIKSIHFSEGEDKFVRKINDSDQKKDLMCLCEDGLLKGDFNPSFNQSDFDENDFGTHLSRQYRELSLKSNTGEVFFQMRKLIFERCEDEEM